MPLKIDFIICMFAHLLIMFVHSLMQAEITCSLQTFLQSLHLRYSCG